MMLDKYVARVAMCLEISCIFQITDEVDISSERTEGWMILSLSKISTAFLDINRKHLEHCTHNMFSSP